MSAVKKLSFVLLALIVVIGIGVVVIYANLSGLARTIVEKEIPNLTFTDLEVGWNDVRLSGVKYSSPKGKVLLEAEGIHISPSLMSFFSDTFIVDSVEISSPYVYIERRRDGELVLPIPQVAAEAETPPGAPVGKAAPATPEKTELAIRVGQTTITNGRGEFVDRSVGKPAARYKISKVNIRLGEIQAPEPAGRIPIEISLLIEGPRQGRFEESGWVDPVNESARLSIEVEDLFIPHAEPYYRSKDTTARLADGTLALKLDVQIDQGRVRLPGEVTMAKLKFKDNRGKFFGVPVAAVGQYLDSNEPVLTVPFEVEGNIDQPDQIRIKVISVIAKRLLERIGVQEVEKVTEKLKQGDIEGAKQEVERIEKGLKKGLKGLFR